MDSHEKLSSWSKQDIKETIEMGQNLKTKKKQKTNMLGQSQIKNRSLINIPQTHFAHNKYLLYNRFKIWENRNVPQFPF